MVVGDICVIGKLSWVEIGDIFLDKVEFLVLKFWIMFELLLLIVIVVYVKIDEDKLLVGLGWLVVEDLILWIE